MISANELRIGNLIITDDDITCEVSRIETNEFTNWNSGEDYSITAKIIGTKENYLNVLNDNWKPIQLSQEILLKCGFEYSADKCNLILGAIIFTIYKGTGEYYIYSTLFPNLKYLHQLQNLYFALTGQELNVEL